MSAGRCARAVPQLTAALEEFYKNFIKKQGVVEARVRAVQQAHQADFKQHRQRRAEAIRGHAGAVREIRCAVRIRPADAGGAGLSGIAARSEREESCRCYRRDADHAGDRGGAEGRRHPSDRAQHPRRHEVHGPVDDALLPGCQVQRRGPTIVRIRLLQRRARQHRQACARKPPSAA